MTPKLAIALTIAGSDSSGGAGIQADLKTFTALGVYGASVLTALTAQNTQGVRAVHAPPAAFVTAQIDAVLDDLDVGGVKTGMLANADIVLAVAEALQRRPSLPLVVDPVMVATSGDRLLEPDAVDAYKTRLIPRAQLITPNLPEAAALLGEPVATDLAGAERQARALLSLGCGAVLVKGGHREASEAIDVLATADGRVEFVRAPWIATRNTHGTGCTLSAAIAGLLARRDPLAMVGAPSSQKPSDPVTREALVEAVWRAKTFLTQALQSAAAQRLGHGHGPVDHLYDIRRHPRPV